VKPLPRRALLGAVALAAVALAALANVSSTPEAEEAPPAPSTRVSDAPAQGPAALELGSAFQPRPLPRAEDAFGVRDWDPHLPASAPRAAAPAKPAAPPLPFIYLGRMVEGGKTTVFLERGGGIVVARAEQAIDATYRLDSVGPGRIVFTYLPLKTRQVLSITADQ
jgi:hypothetical protein